MTTRQRSTLLLALTLIVGCTRRPGSQEEKQKAVVAVGGKTAVAYLPLTIAEHQGFFREEGIEVEVQDLQGGAKALQALVAGSADLVVGYYDHTIQMQARDKEITAVVLLARYPGLVLAVRSDLADRVRDVIDLKGMKVGVTSPGSSSHFMVQYLLSKHGLKPDDIAAIGIGTATTAVAAVQQKQVDALVTMDPAITVLESRGLVRILADTRTRRDTEEVYGGEYPGASLYTTRDFIERHPDATSRLVRGIARALRWIQGKRPDEISSALPDSYFAGDRELYLKGLANSMEMFSPDGRVSDTAPRRVMEVLSLFDESVRNAEIDLSRTYTNRFVDEALEPVKVPRPVRSPFSPPPSPCPLSPVSCRS